MFYFCAGLESLNLSSFDTESVTSMNQMFYGCHSLKVLDIKNFSTPNLEIMNSLFKECYLLESIDISNFNTTKVRDMSFLFEDCRSLKSVDLSNFNTPILNSTAEMFRNCYQVTSINLSTFNTELVTNMGHMFTECRSLKSLNLSNFITTNVQYIDYMFYNCNSLEYLDIINFNTEKVNNYENMFYSTNSLISLDLINFIITESKNIENMTLNINPNIILCYNASSVTNDFLEKVDGLQNNCKNICDIENRIFIPEVEKCTEFCYHSETAYKYEYQRKCYTECPIRTKFYSDIESCEECRDYYDYNQTGCLDSIPDGYYNNDTTNKTIDICPIECKTCTSDSINNNLCTSCNVDKYYYHILNDSLNTGSYYKCYYKDVLEANYYLEDNIYKPCYYKCKACNGSGTDDNNNCLECREAQEYMFDNGNCNLKSIETNKNELSNTDIIEKEI